MVGQIGLPGGGISYGHHYSGIGVPSTGFAAPGGFPRNVDEALNQSGITTTLMATAAPFRLRVG
ncbi:trimethylamine-N-oxide reductase [Photobacterium aphoticum]|uniref:Trimethylamine-N-oxide reductase n=1 Tax=Photobacterium aphoticum TaxID=754436 RepID=A0A090QZB8_9GAMM|nr:trimethylamine-N-oxide reductase [Photobacterium aphoticum]